MVPTTEVALPQQSFGRRRHRRRLDVVGIGLWCFTGLVVVFLFAPVVIIFLTSFTASRTVEFPPMGLSLGWYRKFLDTLMSAPGTHPGLAKSIWFSINLGLLTALLATFAGVLAAYALHKFVFRGKEVFQSIILLPLTFPSLVIGVGLLLTFSELRLFDRFTRLLIGHVVVALPYVILSVGASLRVYEEDVEEAARSLGANLFRVVWHITLPLIRPGILAGAMFAFVTSFTNFTVSFFLSIGSVKPIPIWVYESIMNGYDPLIAAISVFLVAMTIGVLFVLERLIGIRTILGGRK